MRGGWKAMAGVVVLIATLAVPAGPVSAEDYPTWDQVQAAKADVATREAEATRITAFVDELEAEAGRLGDAAVEAAAVSAAAEAARAGAEARAGTLRAQADAAAAEAAASAARLGRVGALLARSGGADVTLRLLFGAEDDSDLLVGLSRAAQLADIYGGVAARAKAARADAAALSEQADVAEAERTRLAAEAAAAAEAAEAAHDAAEARAAEQQAVLDTLYAQLASLRDRTVELERQYRIGEQAAQERAAREAAAAAAAAAAAGRRRWRCRRQWRTSPGRRRRPCGGEGLRREPASELRLGFRPVPLPRPAVDARVGLAGRRLQRSSGAYGIPQSLPGSKMASAGADWRTNAATQINWGLGYIDARYGSPCGAWAHSEAVVQLVLMVDQDEREVFRRHGAEGVLLLGGGAALLLQLADPRVAHGVARHSDFQERPFDRLFGTLDYIYAVGFGDDELADAAVRAVNARPRARAGLRRRRSTGVQRLRRRRPALGGVDARGGLARPAGASLGTGRRGHRRRDRPGVRRDGLPAPGGPPGLARDPRRVRAMVVGPLRSASPWATRRGPSPARCCRRRRTSRSEPRSCSPRCDC